MNSRERTEDYWDAYTASLAPPRGSAKRNLREIRARLDAGEVVDDTLPSAPRQRRVAAMGLGMLGKSASASVGIAGATLLSIKLAVVGWTQLTAPEPPAEPAPAPAGVEVEAESRPDPTPASPAPVLESPPSVTPTPVSPSPAASPEPAKTRGRAMPPADALRAEVALMDRARSALERNDARALLQMMNEHAKRFPKGALTEERNAWRAVAACRLGHADASSRAARFLAAHPGSAQAGKVRKACDGLPVDRVTDEAPPPG